MKKNLIDLLAAKAKILLLVASVSTAFTACKDDPANEPSIVVKDLYQKGVFIVNEGNFGSADASIDFYYRDSAEVIPDIFTAVNGIPLGSLLQSLTIVDTLGYAVLNGSGKIQVMSVNNFVYKGTITGLTSPRYFIAVSATKGYVTDWVRDNIKVIDLSTNTVIDSIDVGVGPEQLIKVGNKVFVANSGSYGLDTTISVINPDNDQVIQTITIGDKPTAFKLDANNKLWVLCAGNSDFINPVNNTKGSLVRLNPDTYTIEATFMFADSVNHPDRLVINKQKNILYYTYSYGFGFGIRKHSISDVALSSSAFITGNYYGLGYDPIGEVIYCGDAKGFTQEGEIVRFDNSGVEIDRFATGFAPNGIHME
jgi:YVTN family beta-propeller protein